MKNKNVYIIAGPNGSGKTTFAKTFLPEYTKCDRFINADLIAAGLSPFLPQQAAMKAGKLVLEQIKEYSADGVDFCFETTMSGVTYLRNIGCWWVNGCYLIILKHLLRLLPEDRVYI